MNRPLLLQRLRFALAELLAILADWRDDGYRDLPGRLAAWLRTIANPDALQEAHP